MRMPRDQPLLDRVQHAIERLLALPMFGVTLALATLFAAYAARLSETVSELVSPGRHGPYVFWVSDDFMIRAGLLLYLVVVGETLLHLALRAFGGLTGRDVTQAIWQILVPVTRLCPASWARPKYVYLPTLGYRRPSHRLDLIVQNALALPMLCMAVLIIPVLAVEFLAADFVSEHPPLKLCLLVALAAIWLAFALEFLLMFALAPRALDFLRRHWLDLAILLLPLIAFMRSFQLLRVLQMGQVARLSKTWRLRALAMRVLRSLLLITAIQRLLRPPPPKQLAELREDYRRREDELSRLRVRIRELQVEKEAYERLQAAKREAKAQERAARQLARQERRLAQRAAREARRRGAQPAAPAPAAPPGSLPADPPSEVVATSHH